MKDGIEAVAFDCYGTLVDFGDESFARAYGVICAEQGLSITGQQFYDKWMEIWRRLAREGQSADGGSVGVSSRIAALGPIENEPGPLSETEEIPPHPAHHTPSAGRNRALDGPLPHFRPYQEEWPEHFELCFEELGANGDAQIAHERLRELLCEAPAFEEALRVVEAVRAKLPIALLSNADDNFLLPCLAYNGLSFPVIVSSEAVRAYKPHVAIFRELSEKLQLAPEKIIYVGDSRLADVAGAKNAGMRVAWVNRKRHTNKSVERGGGFDDTHEPDYEIESLEGLIDILDLS